MTVRSATVRLSADTSAYVSGMRHAESATRSLDQTGGRTTSNLRRGFQLVSGAAATIGVGRLVTQAVTLEATYSKTMAQIGVATQAPATRLAALDDLAIKLGADTVFSANESADAMLALAKGGLTPAQIEAGALRQALVLATAGSLDLDTAANAVVNTMGAFRLRANQSREAVSALAGAANASSSDVGDITLALSQVGTSAYSAGLSVQETTAFLAAFSNAGIRGSDAGTSLKTMLQRLVPTTDAQAAAMERLGLTFTKRNGEFVDAVEMADRLQTAFKGLTTEERSRYVTAIFGSDAQRAANILIEEGAEGIEKYVKATSDRTQAEKLSEAAMSGTAGALERLRGAGETALLQFGRGAAPTVQRLADDLDRLISDKDFRKWGREAGEGIETLLDSAKPFAEETLPLLNDGLATVQEVLAVVGPMAKGFSDAFQALPEDVRTALIQATIIGGAAAKIRTAAGGLGVGKGALGIATKAAPIPVFVVNEGFGPGLPGAGKPGGGPGGGNLPPAFLGSLTRAITLGGGALAGGQLASIESNKKLRANFVGVPEGADPEAMQKFLTIAMNTTGEMNNIADAVKGVDDGLSQLGRKTALNKVESIAKATGLSIEDLTTLLPKTTAAFGALDGSVKSQARGARQLTKEIFDTAVALERSGLTAKEYKTRLNELPKEVRTQVLSPGAIDSMRDVRALRDQYDLTPRQVQTLISLLGGREAINTAARVQSYYAGIPRSITTNIITNHIDKFERMTGGNPARLASGGAVTGWSPNARADNILVAATAGEHMWSVAEVQAAGGHNRVARLRQMAREGLLVERADGGAIGDVSRTRFFASSPGRGRGAGGRGTAGSEVAMRITNWREGTGYIREVTDDRMSDYDAHEITTGGRYH